MQSLPHEQPLWGISPTPLSHAEPEPKRIQTETHLTMQLRYLQTSMANVQPPAQPDAAATSELHRMKQPGETQEGAAAPGIETAHSEGLPTVTEGVSKIGEAALLVAILTAVCQTMVVMAILHHNLRAGPSQCHQRERYGEGWSRCVAWTSQSEAT